MVTLTEESVVYAAKSKLLDLAYDIAGHKNVNKSPVKEKVAQASKIYLWLQALDNDVLSLATREKIWLCLIEIAQINDFPVAPTLGQTAPPSIIIGGSTITNIVNNLDITVFKNNDVDGTEVVDLFEVTASRGALWIYTIRKGSNQRDGLIQASWLADGSQITKWHDATSDIGDTTGVTMDVDFNAGNIRLLAIATSSDWIVEGRRILTYPQ